MKRLSSGLAVGMSAVTAGLGVWLGYGIWGQEPPVQKSIRECRVHVVVDAYARPHDGVGVGIRPWDVACRDLPDPTR